MFSRLSGRFLKPNLGKSGYLRVWLLGEDGKQHNFYLHQLVALVVHGRPKLGLTLVRHTGGNKLNIVSSNLAWGTPQQNSDDQTRLGEARYPRGEQHRSAMLTEAAVIEMRRRRALGEDCRTLARDFNMSYDTAYAAVTRKTWKCVA